MADDQPHPRPRPHRLLAALQLLLALALAAIGTAASAAALLQSLQLLPFALVITVLHAFALGLPAYLLLRRFGEATWFSAGAIGFLLGAIPTTLLILLRGPTSFIAEGVGTILGSPPGSPDILVIASTFGMFGAIAGFLFWCALGLLRTGPLTPRTRSLAAIATIALTTTAAFAIPRTLQDRTCHNPARLQGNIGPVAAAYLQIDNADWPSLVATFQAFAHQAGWSLRVLGTATTASYLSACSQSGTQIMAIRPIPTGRTNLYVNQPQPGAPSWQDPARDLLSRLATQWPGQLGFTGPDGRETGPPAWYQR